MESLDLVIAVDTSVAHLVGALGREVWILVPFAPDWRWRRAGDKSVWYPTATLFRQQRFGDWVEVFGRVAAALGEWVCTPRESRIPVPLTAAELHALIAVSDGDLRDRLRAALPEALAA